MPPRLPAGRGVDCMVVQYRQLFPHEETPQASAAKSYPAPRRTP